MLGEHGIDRKARIAVARGEQDDVVPAILQPGGEVPAMRLHAACERLRDTLADMREDGDPHAATASGARAAAASSSRRTRAVLA